MIVIHIAVLVGVLLLWVGAAAGWIPYEQFVNKKEFHRIVLILLVGNLLGGGLSWEKNQNRIIGEDAYIERPSPGEGSDTKEFLVDAGGEQVSLALDIPQQPGEEPQEDGVKQKEEETLREAILQAAITLNEAKQEEDKYYLPDEVRGKSLQWQYPPDHSGMLILGLAFVAGIAIALSRQREREQALLLRREQMLRDYPSLVTKLCLLVQAGMTVRRAFNKTALDYRKNHGKKDEPRYAYEEMLVTYYEMESGVSEIQAYDNFGRRCGQVQYRTLATLLCQNLKKGSGRLLETLERESISAFEDRKRQGKIQGEAAATKLLIPMVLMLLVVLVILMVPAFLSFYS